MPYKKIILVLFALILFIISGNNAFGQEIKRTIGEAQIRQEINKTKEQVREKAKELAIIDALENEFGTYVGQETDMSLNDGKISFNTIGTTKVKGAWVETTDISFEEEKREIKGQYGKELEIWITCRIKGKAKKATPKADIFYQTLNCPNTECRTVEYISGEQLYLNFKTPVSGYLSIWLCDNDKAYRLLPYENMKDKEYNVCSVKADKDYVFFAKENNYFKDAAVDEQELFTNSKIEYNTIYIIFSEQHYVKPILNNAQDLDEYKKGYKTPKSVDIDTFKKWLSLNRATSGSFLDKKIKISIANK
jgi:hypothetical protein